MSFKGKALMIGSASVGKTSLLARYVDGKFFEEYHQTVGANFLIKEINLTNIVNRLKINPELKKKVIEKGFSIYWWDIGGQSDKLFVTEYYFLEAVGSILVFDVTNRESFDNLDFWILKLKELSGDIPFIIVGNKIDLENKRKITNNEGIEKAKKYGVTYLETSAKENSNVVFAFELMASQILNKMLK